MKILSILLAIGMIALGGVFASPALFRYDAARMNAGAMYSYVVSDFEGKNPMPFYLYPAGDNKVEYFKDFSAFGSSLFSGTFELHKTYFLAAPLGGGNPLSYLKIASSNNQTTSIIDFANKKNINRSYFLE